MPYTRQQQPHRAADLMAYMMETASNAKKYRWPSWLVYDQNFRQLMAARKYEVWAKIDAGIYAQCFTNQNKHIEVWCRGCQSIEHNSSNCPLGNIRTYQNPRSETGTEPPVKRSSTICRNFNTNGCKFNTSCYRHHVCLECQGAHLKSKCPNGTTPGPSH